MSQSADLVLPFQLDAPNLRGRVVRLGPALGTLLGRHDYPEAIARLLGEALTLTTLLAGMLKFDGVFTLQAKGSGAVRTLVVDMTSAGGLRAYARYDEQALAALGSQPDAAALLGDGVLAFTVDQGQSSERYQGLVELQGRTLTDFIQHYFRQSEQIDTAFCIAVTHQPVTGWQAGGLMLQRLPERAAASTAEQVEDDWRRCMLLMSTLTDRELTDTHLVPQELLYRLFHEEEVRVYEPLLLKDICRCSAEKVSGVLAALSADDLADLTAQGPAQVRCEFCARTYTYTAEEISALRSS